MLLPNHIDYLVRKARYEGFIREAEQANLLKAINQNLTQKSGRRFIGWVGTQMIRLGARLQHYGTTAPRRLA